jgi:O-antigen ligase
MRRYAPFVLLVPPVVLLFLLPSTFRDESAYPMTPANHILSILVWICLFCVVLGLSRRSRLTRLFVIAAAFVFLIRSFYRFEIGESGLLYFLISLFVTCGVSAYIFVIAPHVRKRTQNIHDHLV